MFSISNVKALLSYPSLEGDFQALTKACGMPWLLNGLKFCQTKVKSKGREYEEVSG